ncbi:DNA glycosylase AlkZ-like family protein, partial [Pseudonocardia pini]|uniref:DNA glycosylase AlkZ-like family protein n=1 Tax=Pseudonocardia pini TaxID=2758030 RepID=UPI0015F00984
MSESVELDRRRVLAHRFARHGLAARSAGPVAGLRVLRLGVQDSPPGSLPLALAARREAVRADLAGLVVIWSHRGAPHLHPREALPALAAASWPVSEADAAARLGWQRKRLAEIGIPVTEALRVVAAAMAEVLAAGPRVKGELSAEVTARIPAELSPWCGPCEAHHV